MKFRLIGCSHHNSPIEIRERIAFSPDQVPCALTKLRDSFPNIEAVLLSTCNRVELYTATTDEYDIPSPTELVQFLAAFHGLRREEIEEDLFQLHRDEAVRHLFTVAASLDSMVMGEAQILSQVKTAYQIATDGDFAGPLTHAIFQAAIRAARRVSSETAIHEKRVSIPSVAVADFARQIFERFNDKTVLVIGAGEMGQETLTYLVHEGIQKIYVANRNPDRAQSLASECKGIAVPWSQLSEKMIEADLVVSTTGASRPIFSIEDYKKIEHARFQRTLFILDLAVPRDFDPAIDSCLGVYLYCLDDLQKACESNRKKREKEWPKAQKIIEAETAKFISSWNRRSTGPVIRQLKENADQLKSTELTRLLNKLDSLDSNSQKEIEQSFDRLVNKLLHPPLESLRDDAERGAPQGLLDALKRLFQLND